MTPRIIALGVALRPLERIAAVGDFLGLSRASSYRQSASWPLVGEQTNRYVVTARLLEDLGIPYTVEVSDETD